MRLRIATSAYLEEEAELVFMEATDSEESLGRWVARGLLCKSPARAQIVLSTLALELDVVLGDFDFRFQNALQDGNVMRAKALIEEAREASYAALKRALSSIFKINGAQSEAC